MKHVAFNHGCYTSTAQPVSLIGRWFPSIKLYSHMAMIIAAGSKQAKINNYTKADWYGDSFKALAALESVGIKLEVTGCENLSQAQPCLLLSNHMSVFETFVLPVILQSYVDVTFVVKKPLMTLPIFKDILHIIDPIAVGQTNPREDFKTMMEQGMDRLGKGLSLVIFPQGERLPLFDRKRFNTIGIKLAKKANVPIIPVALRTDAWSIGKIFMDIGKIDASKTAHIAFGEPMTVRGNGQAEHQLVLDFIENKLEQWGAPLFR